VDTFLILTSPGLGCHNSRTSAKPHTHDLIKTEKLIRQIGRRKITFTEISEHESIEQIDAYSDTAL
jgi:hypothetical protein